ncbi:hypothetical protein AJ80_02224 [Polytolypa hystricis UAMH7299]|uniref:Uncharacterized protein n=1 Tax=Polytolypa hystricis (strain UAMH7299) TaxID=1447883 RepID=A0A2B7YI79_POLH7|nr:hypothetical protein AJ80_02224 [Polytolypa hystricis UAMH7299]
MEEYHPMNASKVDQEFWALRFNDPDRVGQEDISEEEFCEIVEFMEQWLQKQRSSPYMKGSKFGITVDRLHYAALVSTEVSDILKFIVSVLPMINQIRIYYEDGNGLKGFFGLLWGGFPPDDFLSTLFQRRRDAGPTTGS